MNRTAPLIAHIVYRFGIGGLENGIVNLVNRMPAQRWRHVIIALTEVSGEFADRVERDDVRVDAAQRTLREFASEMLPSIDAALALAKRGAR